ncbi:hypothetical protein H8E07_22510 [bacterium]|nr:hypothetical protein [bacterium]
MKRSTNLKRLALAGLAACLSATPAAAQDPLVDLELSDIQVEIFEDRSETFQLRPVVTLRNAGGLASHAFDVAMYYVPFGLTILHDTVTYVQDNNDCWQQPISDCGGGCLDIYTGLGWFDGFCASSGFLLNCGCLYVINKEFEPVPYSLGYTTVTVTVDPYNLVPEADETNNQMTIDLGAIPNDAAAWGAIKSMYR